MSGLGLVRKGNGQDVGRVSTTLGWQRRDVSSWGFVNVFNASARGDYYSIADRDEGSLVGGAGMRLQPDFIHYCKIFYLIRWKKILNRHRWWLNQPWRLHCRPMLKMIPTSRMKILRMFRSTR